MVWLVATAAALFPFILLNSSSLSCTYLFIDCCCCCYYTTVTLAGRLDAYFTLPIVTLFCCDDTIKKKDGERERKNKKKFILPSSPSQRSRMNLSVYCLLHHHLPFLYGNGQTSLNNWAHHILILNGDKVLLIPDACKLMQTLLSCPPLHCMQFMMINACHNILYPFHSQVFTSLYICNSVFLQILSC